MGVTPNSFKSLNFGGIDSADYGVYITGAGVYNAPARAAEIMSVPGRNGDVIIDKGHWDNITIEYPAGAFGQTQEEFRDSIRAFRNAIAPLIGYQRLTDDYNPDEYREAIFTGGMEVEPVAGGRAGEFKLVFNCKPQRYLVSGETPVTVSSGDTLTNPTGYDSQPLLAIDGHGTINLGLNQINIISAYYGAIDVARGIEHSAVTDFSETDLTIDLDETLYNPGDKITITALQDVNGFAGCNFQFGEDFGDGMLVHAAEFNSAYKSETGNVTAATWGDAGAYLTYSAKLTIEITAGTSSTGQAIGNWRVIQSVIGDIPTYAGDFNVYINVDYNAAQERVTISARYGPGGDDPMQNEGFYCAFLELASATATANSTKTYLGDPTYIDLELGDAYAINAGTYISLNKYISLPANLPTLAPGANEITYSDTVTDLQITPRWWRL